MIIHNLNRIRYNINVIIIHVLTAQENIKPETNKKYQKYKYNNNKKNESIKKYIYIYICI